MVEYLVDSLERIGGVEFVFGSGAQLRDSEGRDWLDFFADVGTASLGYCPLQADAALSRMLRERIPIHAPNMYNFRERSRAAERLCVKTGMDKVFFSNSGAEAVEAAIKMARLKSFHEGENRSTVVGVRGAFHGRTLATLAVGDGPAYHTEGQGPLPGGFVTLEESEIPEGIPRDAAAVVIAPVFGNNDVREYNEHWLVELAEYCACARIALIFDEVQTGAGRAGSLTYSTQVGITPDILALAKGVAMGAPVGATLAVGAYADAIRPGRHFSTFGGNPFSAVMVNSMLDWLDAPGNLSGVELTGDRLRDTLRKMGVRNVRGPGMLVAFDYYGDCLELAHRCQEQRLLIGAFRPGPGPVKITPPLNTTLRELEDGLQRLSKAMGLR